MGDASFREAQETLHYVAKEIEWQGLGPLRGICASLQSAGCGGKHRQNIKRDMLRKLEAKNPDAHVPIDRVDVPLYELCEDGSYDIKNRQMPVILPHRLFPWMMQAGFWPKLGENSIRQYWQHLKDVGSPLSSMSDDGCHIPLYLWGDVAQYTESGESMSAFCCGIVVDDNRSNIFPLFLCKEDLSTGSDTLWAFLDPVVKSFTDLYDGLPASSSSQSPPLKFVVTEIRGDWKYLVEILQLSRWYRCSYICHRCWAHKDTYMCSPAQLESKQRCSDEDFFRISVKPGERCPIFQLPRWIPQCIRFDSMHVLCLGVDLLVAGNVIKTLLGYGFWGDGEEDQQLLVGWQLFKQWAKRMGWQHSVPRFCPKRLKSNQHPYPELQSKAWNGRVVIAWLSDALQDYAKRAPDDMQLKAMQVCTTELAKFHRVGELNERYLSKCVAERMSRFCDRSISAYIELANKSLEKKELAWPSRPKFHAWQEICQLQLEDRLNHRLSAGWHLEDFVGKLMTSLCISQTAALEESGLVRWYMGLSAQNNLNKFDAQV